MKTCCPGCATRYEIDAEDLLAADGRARCLHCGTVFDAVSEQPEAVTAEEAAAALRLDDAARADAHRASDAEIEELPFDIPDDLEPIEPSADGAVDVLDTLYEKRSYRGIVYGLLAVLLLGALGAQLAWQHRDDLIARVPQLEIVCRYLPCRPDLVHKPDSYRIVQRDIAPTRNEPGSLTLSATIRNDAAIAQRLPDIQLSLLDNNGTVLVRRRLSPNEYLFPPPANDRVVQPGEVFTIHIDFADPGHIASGFAIDFF